MRCCSGDRQPTTCSSATRRPSGPTRTATATSTSTSPSPPTGPSSTSTLSSGWSGWSASTPCRTSERCSTRGRSVGQIEGGIMQGVGLAVMEELILDNGRHPQRQLHRLSAADVRRCTRGHGGVRRGAEPLRAIRRQGRRRATDDQLDAGRRRRHPSRHRQADRPRPGATGRHRRDLTAVADFDLAAIYRTARERLRRPGASLDATGSSPRTVPTCPAWTVQDTYAHLTGLAADVVGGGDEVPGQSMPPPHARSATRRGHSIDELCDEWQATVPTWSAHRLTTACGCSLAIDAWTHDQDIHNALGLVSGRTGPGLELTMIARVAAQANDPGAGAGAVPRRDGIDHDWLIGDDRARPPRSASAPTSSHAWSRHAAAVAQMRSYDWEGDPEPYLAMHPHLRPPRSGHRRVAAEIRAQAAAKRLRAGNLGYIAARHAEPGWRPSSPSP